MSKLDLSLTAASAEVSGGNYNSINVELTGVDADDVMSALSVEDVVKYFGASDLLDEIGEQAARDHFGITED